RVASVMTRSFGAAMTLHELAMRRHSLDRIANHRAHAQRHRLHFLEVDDICERIVAPRDHTLPQQDRHPAVLAKVLVIKKAHASTASKELDLVAQRVGHIHGSAVLPERRVATRRSPVVKDEEVANSLVLGDGESVVLL